MATPKKAGVVGAVGIGPMSTGKRTKAASRVFGEELFEEPTTTVAAAGDTSLCYSTSPSTRSSSESISCLNGRKSYNDSANSNSSIMSSTNPKVDGNATVDDNNVDNTADLFETNSIINGRNSSVSIGRRSTRMSTSTSKLDKSSISVSKNTDVSFSSSFDNEKENKNNSFSRFGKSVKVGAVAGSKNPFASATGMQKAHDEELRRLRETKRSPMRQKLMKKVAEALRNQPTNVMGSSGSSPFLNAEEKSNGGLNTSGDAAIKNPKMTNMTSSNPKSYSNIGSRSQLTSALKKSGNLGSVNHAVNASRKAKSSVLRYKHQAVKSVRFQWQQEISETKQLNEKIEENRRKIRMIQKKLSSAHFRDKAQKDESKKFERFAKLEKEYVFKSEVYSDHQKRLKEEQDQKRRESIAARAKIRQNNREGLEKLRMMKIEEEQANFEVSADLHKARIEAARASAEARRKSFQFRSGDARKIRCMREIWREQELRAQHESFELKRAASKDVENYKRQVQALDREDKRSRNLEARERRKLEAEAAHAAMMAEHKSYELKWDGERDVEAYEKKMQEERRKSLAGRNKESAHHAKVMEELRGLAKQKEAEDYMLKWGGENDVKDYLAKMAEERRKSLQQRAADARKVRNYEEEEHAKAVQNSLEEMILQSECQKDVERYKAECAERDRKSLQYRGKQLQLQHLEEEKRRIEQFRKDEENSRLETLARKDVEEYYKDCQKRRRKSLAWRAKERRRNFEWKRKKTELEVKERAHTSYLHSLDLKHMALAQEEERAKKAMDALRNAGCTFHGNPFLDL